MTVDPALHAREQWHNANPLSNKQELFIAKVTAVYPSLGMIEVAPDALPHQGGTIPRVRVTSWNMATQTGASYFPSNIKLANPIPSSEVTAHDQAIPSGEQDVWGVIAFVGGRTQIPVCLGFLTSWNGMTNTADPGWEVHLHESGVWSATDPAGNVTLGLPDGSTVAIGPTATPADMTTQNASWKPKTTTSDYSVALNIKGNVTITVNGDATVDAANVYLGTTQGSGAAVARVGDTVANGVITSGSSKVFAG